MFYFLVFNFQLININCCFIFYFFFNFCIFFTCTLVQKTFFLMYGPDDILLILNVSINECKFWVWDVHLTTALSQYKRCSHRNSCHHSTGNVHTTTAAITAQEMFTWQQLPSQHRRCSNNNSCHHSTGDVHTTTAAIAAQEMFTQQQLPSQHMRCLHDNSCLNSTGDVHTITAAITAQPTRSIIK